MPYSHLCDPSIQSSEKWSHLILEGGHAAGKACARTRPSACTRSSGRAVGVGVRGVPRVGPQVVGLAVGLELHSSSGMLSRPAHTSLWNHMSSMRNLTRLSPCMPEPSPAGCNGNLCQIQVQC